MDFWTIVLLAHLSETISRKESLSFPIRRVALARVLSNRQNGCLKHQ